MWQEAVVKNFLEMGDQRQASWRCFCLWKSIQGDPWDCVLTGRAGKSWNCSKFSSLPSSQGEGHHSQPWVTTGGGTAWEMGWDLSTIPEPLPKTPPAAGQSIISQNSHKFAQIQAKAAARGSGLSMGSPKGGAAEAWGLQGLSTAPCHSTHGKIQQLFKVLQPGLHFHLKIQAIHVLLARVWISGADFFYILRVSS